MDGCQGYSVEGGAIGDGMIQFIVGLILGYLFGLPVGLAFCLGGFVGASFAKCQKCAVHRNQEAAAAHERQVYEERPLY